MLGDKGLTWNAREGFTEEVMILSLDFKEELEYRWYLEEDGGRGKGGIQSSWVAY